MTSTAHEDQFLPHPDDVAQAQPKRRPYNASASLSEYGIFPECDAQDAIEAAMSAVLAESGAGVYYMNPPDGGGVLASEQVRRMAEDAARYRWLRDRPEQAESALIDVAVWSNDFGEAIRGNDLDAAIDAAIAQRRKGEGGE